MSAGTGPEIVATMSGEQRLGPTRLLATDVGMWLLVLNNARREAMERVTGLTGLSGPESLIITLLALSAAADALEPTPPQIPALAAGDFLIGGSVVREVVHRVAGPSSRAVPGFAGLVAFGLIWKYHPLARGSFRI